MVFLLWLAPFFNGCKEYPSLVKEGPLFAAAEKVSPAEALVYVYWPREEQGRRSHLWVGPCGEENQEIRPGGYTAFVVGLGPSCFKAEMHSELVNNGISVVLDLASVELNTEPGHTFFVRLEQERILLTSRIVLRLVKPDAADLEIRRCRRSIPLTPDEMAQKYLQWAEK